MPDTQGANVMLSRYAKVTAICTFLMFVLVTSAPRSQLMAATETSWQKQTLLPNTTMTLPSLLRTTLIGTKTWRVAGACDKNSLNLTTHSSGFCRVTVTIKARGKSAKTFSSRFKIVSATIVAPSTTAPTQTIPATSLNYVVGVPAKDSALWNVAIGSYVRGKDVFPLDKTLPAATAVACSQAKKVSNGVVVLSFGIQTATGTSGWGIPISYENIAKVAAAWASGLATCGTGQWEVSIGTSNAGGVSRYNGYLGGVAMAVAVGRSRELADSRVVISGAMDLEPGWGPPGQARAWVDGYVATTSARLWNFGSADGCPQTVGKLTCNNGWTIDDVLWVSSHAGANVIAMPQIHTQSGSQARQWAVLAARSIEMKKALRIGALTVQTAACTTVKGGCPTTGVSAWDAWTQLRRALDAIVSTAGTPIGAPMDIRWGWGGPFYVPPATTTTTTTTTTIPPTTTTDGAKPTVTLAASAATSTSGTITFTVTGNEAITCSTLSTASGIDFTLTNISALTGIVQTSSTVCTVTATSTASADGIAVVSTLTAAGSFSITDTAGNAQTTLTASPKSVTVTIAAA